MEVSMIHYCVHAEFYDSGKVKACIVSREAKKRPSSQYQRRPGVAMFQIWAASAANAIELLDLIKKGDCDLDDILQLYSDKLELERRLTA